MQATAIAHANIAFIKYWGNSDESLRIPVNPSLSMNLDGVSATTTVTWQNGPGTDRLILNGSHVDGTPLERVSNHLAFIRQQLKIDPLHAEIESSNNFPMGAGIASSAAAFAALTVSAVSAAGLSLTERELSALARYGSGSASRSVPTGFVEWYRGSTHHDSYAESIAAPDHWNLIDIIAVVSSEHKAVTSRRGHQTADTSDLQAARVAGAENRLETCKRALLDRDFDTFAQVVEHDSNLMHAVMMTSQPPLFYWLPPTLTIMQAVRDWRAEGIKVCYTLDAGPNVHCICLQDDADFVRESLQKIEGVTSTITAGPGGPARVIS